MFVVFISVVLIGSCSGQDDKSGDWMIGPFSKLDDSNPCLVSDETSVFNCPVNRVMINWEIKDVFNPAVVVRDDKIYLLYRAEDSVGLHLGTSRIGLAESNDGLTFTKRPEPVLYPDNDRMNLFEWDGGCEDPRVVEDNEERYIMTYTAWDGNTARLSVATSADLVNWKKHGLAFGEAYNGKYRDTWSKSGSIVCKLKGNRLVAAQINGKYWMYWGDSDIYLATSENLIDWKPVENENRNLKPVFSPRKGYFDSELVEPGPPALVTEQGIVMIYNSKNSATEGDENLPDGTYAAGQVLMDAGDPGKILKRTEEYFFFPEKPYELTGQVNNVCFLEGLAWFRNKWFLYYGTADSKIAVAVYDPKSYSPGE
ncbi:MAG: glycosidase [Bacteroidetes bacterium]|nr:glycosidase [Bacteroidota bacterium]